MVVAAPNPGARDAGSLINILDGVAKVHALQSPGGSAEAGVVMGTEAYGTPEHQGRSSGPARRHFSVGIMAVEAVTGRLSERNPTDGAVLASSIAGRLPRRLVENVLSCVALISTIAAPVWRT